MKRGEIWWVDCDPSVGGEARKTRPCIIVSADIFNRNLNRVQVVPCTSNTEKIYPGEASIQIPTIGQRKATCNLILTASLLRFKTRIGALSPEDMRAVEAALRVQLDLSE